uniref:Uncharacterized protein n=1 Tax=Anguilla anguilla TaxID=7936 RepID=A0A0E9TG08_ANGAN
MNIYTHRCRQVFLFFDSFSW